MYDRWRAARKIEIARIRQDIERGLCGDLDARGGPIVRLLTRHPALGSPADSELPQHGALHVPFPEQVQHADRHRILAGHEHRARERSDQEASALLFQDVLRRAPGRCDRSLTAEAWPARA